MNFKTLCMGKDVQAQTNSKDNAYVKAVQDSGVMLMNRIAKFWLWPGLIFNTFSHGRALRKNIKLMHAFTMQAENLNLAKTAVWWYMYGNNWSVYE